MEVNKVAGRRIRGPALQFVLEDPGVPGQQPVLLSWFQPDCVDRLHLEFKVHDALEDDVVARVGPPELHSQVPAYVAEFELDGRAPGMGLEVRCRKAADRPEVAEPFDAQPDRWFGKPVEPVLIAKPHARGVVELPLPDGIQPDHKVFYAAFQQELPFHLVPMRVLSPWERVLDVQGDRGPNVGLVKDPVDGFEPVLYERELLAAALCGLLEVQVRFQAPPICESVSHLSVLADVGLARESAGHDRRWI